ncbi:hypothetical protein ACPA54_03425 [Uniformispora flossi]|uniref:hypothetical protein n=1 Tax=Uniformispora flossi TaxID=3390723 RepID=UPI003C2C2446
MTYELATGVFNLPVDESGPNQADGGRPPDEPPSGGIPAPIEEPEPWRHQTDVPTPPRHSPLAAASDPQPVPATDAEPTECPQPEGVPNERAVTNVGDQRSNAYSPPTSDAFRSDSSPPDAPEGLPGPTGDADAATSTPTPEGVEAALQAVLMQRAWLNLGEMVGVKYVFEQTLDYHAPIAPEYLNIVREVYAEPPVEDTGRDSHNEIRLDNRPSASVPPASGAPARTRTARVSFADLCDQLTAPGATIVLPRPAGTGRTITAHALLAWLVDHRFIDEVWPIPFGGSRHFPAKRLPRAKRRGYLLELPPDEDDFAVDPAFGASLGNVQYILSKRESRLIVLTTPEQWQRVSLGAPEGVAPWLGVSKPYDIAARWLCAQEPDLQVDQWLRHDRIAPLLDGQRPVDVLRLVELILEQHRNAGRTADSLTQTMRGPDTGQPTSTSFDEQVANVVAAHNNWEDRLYKWHEEPGRTSFHRNFLLAASVLRGDTVGHIYAKAAELTQHLEKTEISILGQKEPGVIAMTRAVGARRRADDTLVFERPHWDDAALEYFWNDRPLARMTFLRWLAKAPLDERKETLATVDRDDRRALAERVGEFALRWAVRHQRKEPLEEIVKAWYAFGTSKGLWTLAIELLDGAAVRATSAPFIHNMLLAWAGRKDVALQAAVVEVCTGEFGRRHTDKALRRIRHIAASDQPEIIDRLREAVQTLWADESIRTMLFHYVARWCRTKGTADTVGRRTFAALAAYTGDKDDGLPLLLAALDLEDAEGFKPSVPDLVAGWRTLLKEDDDSTSEPEAEAAVFLWLDAARRPDLRNLIFESLRQAVDVGSSDRRQLRDALRKHAYRWVEGEGREFSRERDDIQKALSDQLDTDLLTAGRRHPRRASDLMPASQTEAQPLVGSTPNSLGIGETDKG